MKTKRATIQQDLYSKDDQFNLLGAKVLPAVFESTTGKGGFHTYGTPQICLAGGCGVCLLFGFKSAYIQYTLKDHLTRYDPRHRITIPKNCRLSPCFSA
jgi:hypothetical protein